MFPFTLIRRWRARRNRRVRLTGFSTPLAGISWEYSAGEGEIIRKLLLYLEDRAALSPTPPVADAQRLLRSVASVSAAVTDALQALPADSPAVGPLQAIRKIARLGHASSDDLGVLLLIGEIRGGIGAQLAELAARYEVQLAPPLASLRSSYASLEFLRVREIELKVAARELAEGPRGSRRGYPKDRLYHEGHAWASRSAGRVIVGLTEFAQDEIAEVVLVELPKRGALIEQGSTLAEIETVKCVWDLESPVSGVVITTNPMIDARPELVNEDPYAAGWLAELQLTDNRQLDALLDADGYQALLASSSEPPRAGNDMAS